MVFYANWTRFAVRMQTIQGAEVTPVKPQMSLRRMVCRVSVATVADVPRPVA